jgi:anti-anti-sigma factor
MKIETHSQGTHVVLRVAGRLDAAWAEHLLGAVRDSVREGHHHVRLDAAALEYLSSAGIRALLKIRRELETVNGSFGIVRAVAFVQETLRMSGLEALLLPEGEPAVPAAAPGGGDAGAAAVSSVSGVCIEGHLLEPAGRIGVRLHAAWKPWAPVAAGDIREVAFPRERFGLGIGAAGRDLADIRSRFGDFVAAAGAVTWLPADGADRPDDLVQTERFVPRLHTIQALVGEGAFSHLLRFRPEAKGAFLNVSDLFAQALQATQAEAAALVALVEVEGLVGAALARSPGRIQPADRPGQFPDVRDWLSFCGERVHRQALALVVAFLCRGSEHVLAPHLAPLPSRPDLRAHAHAAVFSFRPLPQGILELAASMRAVSEDNAALAVLHLVEDDRPAVGLGQSSFIRGACWCAPALVSAEALS